MDATTITNNNNGNYNGNNNNNDEITKNINHQDNILPSKDSYSTVLTKGSQQVSFNTNENNNNDDLSWISMMDKDECENNNDFVDEADYNHYNYESKNIANINWPEKSHVENKIDILQTRMEEFEDKFNNMYKLMNNIHHTVNKNDTNGIRNYKNTNKKNNEPISQIITVKILFDKETITVEGDKSKYGLIIGHKGQTLINLRNTYNVDINVPKIDSNDSRIYLSKNGLKVLYNVAFKIIQLLKPSSN